VEYPKEISLENAIDIQEKYQNAIFEFDDVDNRTYEAFSRHLKERLGYYSSESS
jgi:hypothetical protein